MLDGLDIEVKPVYFDRRFYYSNRITLLQVRNYAYVIPNHPIE